MKKLGLVGGLAWPSTMDYYRLLCERTIAHYKSQGVEGLLPTPPVMIDSLVMRETRKLRGDPLHGDESWHGFDQVFRDSLLRLQSAGCELGAIASNTPHARLESIRQGVEMPIVSILEESARAAASTGFPQALVLGTAVTMRENHYKNALQCFDVEANATLPESWIQRMQSLIDEDFYSIDSNLSHPGRNGILEFCQRFVSDADGCVVLLACTELPLAFSEYANEEVFSADGFTFVNTTVAHVQGILSRLLDEPLHNTHVFP